MWTRRDWVSYTDPMTAVPSAPPDEGVRPAYPFKEWLNGQQWILTRGRDFWGDPDDLVRSLQGSARARRLRVTCTWDPRQRCLYVRAGFASDAGQQVPSGPAD